MLKKRPDTVIYNIGKFIWIFLLMFGLIFSYFLYGKYIEPSGLTMCRFKQVTGIPCPGCGGTRAFRSLFEGKIIQSFLYHPVVLYCFFAYAHFMLTYFIRRNITNSIETKPVKLEIYCYILIAIVLVQWVVKVVLVLHYHVEL